LRGWGAADARLAEFHGAIQSIPPGSRVAFRIDLPSWGNDMKPYAFFDAYYWMDRGGPHVLQPVRSDGSFVGPLRMLQRRGEAAHSVAPMRKALEACQRHRRAYVVLWARPEQEGVRSRFEDARCRAMASLGPISIFQTSGGAGAEGRRITGFQEGYDYLFVYGENAPFSAREHNAHVAIFSGANVGVWRRLEAGKAATR
jgi:hypothetical protein